MNLPCLCNWDVSAQLSRGVLINILDVHWAHSPLVFLSNLLLCKVNGLNQKSFLPTMALITGMQLSTCTESWSFASENAHYLPFWLVSFYVVTTLVFSLCIISLTGTFKLVCPFAVNILIFCGGIVRTGGFVRAELCMISKTWLQAFYMPNWTSDKTSYCSKKQKW